MISKGETTGANPNGDRRHQAIIDQMLQNKCTKFRQMGSGTASIAPPESANGQAWQSKVNYKTLGIALLAIIDKCGIPIGQ